MFHVLLDEVQTREEALLGILYGLLVVEESGVALLDFRLERSRWDSVDFRANVPTLLLGNCGGRRFRGSGRGGLVLGHGVLLGGLNCPQSTTKRTASLPVEWFILGVD